MREFRKSLDYIKSIYKTNCTSTYEHLTMRKGNLEIVLIITYKIIKCLGRTKVVEVFKTLIKKLQNIIEGK